ncbi:TauD/TfdA family dioxygenase [Actinokineospora bangkokensis]|uniref:TauD/TfdA family dioxygenase n=1 Tax=Actinokineospora bangkokensis TaxID=1193682 RepID=UPI001E362E44|nr:TauD/TfdA family dioxygenase [Actinokineospora bangkokensis]
MLDAADRTAVGAIAERLAADGGEISSAEWLDRVRDAALALPVGLRRSLRALQRHSGAAGSLLVRGLPIGDAAALPPTPAVGGSAQHTPTPPSAALMLAVLALGEPVAFRAEKKGLLVHDVVPVPGSEEMQGNEGSVDLEFHVENAFHPHRPDHVLLLCLRSDHEGTAGLRLACARRALPLLDDRVREALARPEFVTAPPPSFGGVGDETQPHAVLGGDPDDPDVVVDFGVTRAVTAEGEAALPALHGALAATSRTLVLRPGDLAIVDNRVTLHGRTAFRPRYDGRDRWLQRAFAVSDLRRSRDHRPADGHVLVR